MSKNRLKGWILILFCSGMIAAVLMATEGIGSAYRFTSTIGMNILLYVCFDIAAFFLGKWLSKKLAMDQKSTFVLAVIAIAVVGVLAVFYQQEKELKQLEAEKGTLASVGKDAITAEEIGLLPSSNGIVDSGESYWKSWLDCTVMLQDGGSLQYNCDRYADAEDAEGRLDSYIQSDLSGREYSELPVQKSYTGMTRMEAYEWLTGEDTGIRVFYYYFLADDMVLRVKYRAANGLEDRQLESLVQWFLEK